MWILLIIFSAFSALALEPFDKISNVKILRILSDNIIMLNRGIEDGIVKNDHAKLSNLSEGFTSRAICVKSSSENSYWKIYRVPNAEAINLQGSYSLNGLARENALPESRLILAEREVTKIEDLKDEAKGPNPFTVKRDLPERLTERDLLKTTSPEKRKLFVEQVLNRDQLKRDLKDYQISLYASPFTRQSINDGESLRYGFRGGNVASKYRLLTQFEQSQTKLRDPVTDRTLSTRNTFGQAQFVIHHLTQSISSLSLINYNSQRFSSVATPKAHWQIGVLGFTWHIYESKTWEYMDLSYIPLYDYRQTEVNESGGGMKTIKTNGLRHGLRFGMRSRINERVAFENLLWARPFQDLGTLNVDGGDLNLVNDLKFIFNLTEKLFFDYNLVYQRDKLWRSLSKLPQDNFINSLNLRYDFNL